MPEYSTINFQIEQVLANDKHNGFVDLMQIALIFNVNLNEQQDIIISWLSEKATLDFIWTWEKLSNEYFCETSHFSFAKNAGLNCFSLPLVTWLEATHARSIKISEASCQSIIATRELAHDFACWLSPQFKLEAIQKSIRNNLVLDTVLFEKAYLIASTSKNKISLYTAYSAHYDALLNNTCIVEESNGETLEVVPMRFSQDELYMVEILKIIKVLKGSPND